MAWKSGWHGRADGGGARKGTERLAEANTTRPSCPEVMPFNAKRYNKVGKPGRDASKPERMPSVIIMNATKTLLIVITAANL